jgi:hypothetical protein
VLNTRHLFKDDRLECCSAATLHFIDKQDAHVSTKRFQIFLTKRNAHSGGISKGAEVSPQFKQTTLFLNRLPNHPGPDIDGEQ